MQLQKTEHIKAKNLCALKSNEKLIEDILEFLFNFTLIIAGLSWVLYNITNAHYTEQDLIPGSCLYTTGMVGIYNSIKEASYYDDSEY